MDGSIGTTPRDVSQLPRPRSPHLICGSWFRGVAVTAVCAYFAYRSYAALRDEDFLWEHELWSIATWVVWILLLGGLFLETRCRRERILAVVLLANCLVGLISSASTSLAFVSAQGTRELSLALWLMAALVSLSTIRTGQGGNEQPVK